MIESDRLLTAPDDNRQLYCYDVPDGHVLTALTAMLPNAYNQRATNAARQSRDQIPRIINRQGRQDRQEINTAEYTIKIINFVYFIYLLSMSIGTIQSIYRILFSWPSWRPWRLNFRVCCFSSIFSAKAPTRRGCSVPIVMFAPLSSVVDWRRSANISISWRLNLRTATAQSRLRSLSRPLRRLTCHEMPFPSARRRHDSPRGR